jgi:hypothetical protein
MRDDDENEDENTMSSVMAPKIDPTREIAAVLDELEDLLKNGDVMTALGDRGVNTSLALAAVDGLRAYLAGDKVKAAEELDMVAEEISSRLGAGRTPVPTNGNGSAS